jgi:hypothetical protein
MYGSTRQPAATRRPWFDASQLIPPAGLFFARVDSENVTKAGEFA